MTLERFTSFEAGFYGNCQGNLTIDPIYWHAHAIVFPFDSLLFPSGFRNLFIIIAIVACFSLFLFYFFAN